MVQVRAKYFTEVVLQKSTLSSLTSNIHKLSKWQLLRLEETWKDCKQIGISSFDLKFWKALKSIWYLLTNFRLVTLIYFNS